MGGDKGDWGSGGGGGEGGGGQGGEGSGEGGQQPKKSGVWQGWADRVAADPEFPFKVLLQQVGTHDMLEGTGEYA